MKAAAAKCADCHPHCPGYGRRGSCHEELPARPWWELCFEGYIRRNDETPALILDICEMWHDGKRCPLYAFWQGRAVKPMALAKVASKELSENILGDAEDQRLRCLSIWALRQHQMCQAAAALREANAMFSDAVEALDLDSYDVEQMHAAAKRPS